MCGICGTLSQVGPGEGIDTVREMIKALAHRGPDASGVWTDDEGVRCCLGHSRLSILDLSPAGAQPMQSGDRRYTITFNGEIYNYGELGASLMAGGVRFRGRSDTEVLVEAIARWGVLAVLPKLNGMFSFAVWDSADRVLWLARDRFGEKPLYYGWHGNAFLFGSELKALCAHPLFAKELNTDILSEYIRFNYIPEPYTVFKNTWKLPAAHYVKVSPGSVPSQPSPYWELSDLVAQPRKLRAEAEVIDELGWHMKRAVKRRMVADVPLGAFLSGGIDSSLIVAMMQEDSPRAVKTFTIGFWEGAYNEAGDAARIAQHLRTEHYELYVSPSECMDVIQRLPQIYDEPFADSSQIPTAIVAEFTRKHVTVALSGDGGDEIFGGYNRYVWSSRLWPRIHRVSPAIRQRIARFLVSRSPAAWDELFNVANSMLPSRLRVRGGGEKIHKFASAMGAKNSDELYYSYVSQWQNPGSAVVGGSDLHRLGQLATETPTSLNFVERMMFMDALTYLPSDILHKVDRASMAVGLEVRVPFLDNDLVAFAWSLPLDVKIRHGVGKWPLKKLLNRHVPEASFDRPKTGFGVPIGDWIRGPMRDWTEHQLSEPRLLAHGFFNAGVVRKQWAEHLSGRRNLQHSLWSVIMFQAWHERYCEA